MTPPLWLKPWKSSWPDHISEEDRRMLLLASEFLRREVGFAPYLCGSALEHDNPRDYDIRIEVPDSWFRGAFGPPDQWVDEGSSGGVDRRSLAVERCLCPADAPGVPVE